MKSFLVALLVSGLMAYSSQPSQALPAPPAPVAVAETTSVGAGVYVAGGIIGVAAVLCVYDLYLKINGLKNWDGTPKKGVTPKFP
ncbi:hypothetical protein MXD81_45080 [Microbacteriaceae bacterium K1510]|nr:hypothetical protein [Microbacteriaceae bacterium K1510]